MSQEKLVFGKFIFSECQKKGITLTNLAKKLNISDEKAKELIESHDINQFLGPNANKEETDLLIRKLSGILGIPYYAMRAKSGIPRPSKPHPDYYTEDGTLINVYDILAKIYYQDPKTFQKKLESLIDQ